MKIESYVPRYIKYYRVDFTLSYGEESWHEQVFYLTDRNEFEAMKKVFQDAMSNRSNLTYEDIFELELGENDIMAVPLKRLSGYTFGEERHYVAKDGRRP